MGDFNQVLSNEDKLSFGAQACPGANDLHDCLQEESMIPVNVSRVKFTWNNNRDDEDLLLEWLDSAFVNGEWLNSFEHSSLEAWPITVSDHAPIILDTYRMQTFRKRPQRFEAMCLLHPSCRKVVEDTWRQITSGSATKILTRKIKRVQRACYEWNTRFGKHPKKKIIRAKELTFGSTKPTLHPRTS